MGIGAAHVSSLSYIKKFPLFQTDQANRQFYSDYMLERRVSESSTEATNDTVYVGTDLRRDSRTPLEIA